MHVIVYMQAMGDSSFQSVLILLLCQSRNHSGSSMLNLLKRLNVFQHERCHTTLSHSIYGLTSAVNSSLISDSLRI